MEIIVKPSRLIGEVTAPPSKPYTHRALVAALLSEGISRVSNPLRARDTNATLHACRMLGAGVIEDQGGVDVVGGELKLPEDVLDVENSGTTLRIFTAVSALAPHGYVILTGDESLRKRPMQPLLDALSRLGVECWSSRLNGCAPVIVRSGGVEGGEVRIRGDISSQFISALLFMAVGSRKGVSILVEGDPVSRPYIDATIETLRRFRFRIEREGYRFFHVEGGQRGEAAGFMVPGDFGSASFLLAGAHLTGGEVRVNALGLELPQADAKILDILRSFGSKVEIGETWVKVKGAGGGGGGEFNLRDSPDLIPIVAAMASKSPEETLIKGVRHARFKESNRLESTAMELRKLGVEVKVLPEGLKIRGRKKLTGGADLDAHGDHRLFMALTILSLATKQGCRVSGAEWVDVSYPEFLKHIKALGARVEEA